MAPKKVPDWLTPGLIEVVGKAAAEFTSNLIMIIRARVNGEKIPDDALEKRIRATLKQETAYKLAREIRRARGEDVWVPRERKKVLILDDDAERHDIFRRHLKLYGIRGHHTRKIRDTLDRLRRYEYRYVFLDHDLGYTDPRHDGMQVVDWIAERVRSGGRSFRNTLFVIHSMNPVRAPEMVHRLREVGLRVKRVPVAWEVLAQGEKRVR